MCQDRASKNEDSSAGDYHAVGVPDPDANRETCCHANQDTFVHTFFDAHALAYPYFNAHAFAYPYFNAHTNAHTHSIHPNRNFDIYTGAAARGSKLLRVPGSDNL